MRGRPRFWIAAAVLSFASASALTKTSPPAQTAEPDTITVTVTAISRGDAKPPQIPVTDVVVRQGNKDRPVIIWEPANSNDPKLDLVVMIDDSLANSVATRWDELSAFLVALPAGTRTAVAYANRGAIQMAQQPTVNHVLAAKALRNPAGLVVQDSSIYESVQALVHAWPSREGRRVILLVSSGYDSKFPGTVWDDWPTMQEAIQEAQCKGVVVYSIYAKPFTPATLNPAQLECGQQALGFLSLATGGQAFYDLGFENAPSFQPYFQKIQKSLEQQYLLTFRAEPARKAQFVLLHVSSANKSAQIRYQSSVFVPAAK